MREYTKKLENQSRTLGSNPRASKQAPISDILQAYKNGTLGKQSIQRECVEAEELLQSKRSRQAPINVILQRYKESIQRNVPEEDEELLQGKFDTAQRTEIGIDEEKLLQGKFESDIQTEQEPIQREEKPNNTGLPDNLKTGIENLSGYSMDDVRIHYNSAKPAQLSALAYTQGTDIHIASGQEKHLPHEAWHVVQQKQGRVQPTMQLKDVDVNDDERLEREADEMGVNSINNTSTDSHKILKKEKKCSDNLIQKRVGFEFQTNLLLRDGNSKSPKLRVPLFSQGGWHIECDQGELEFVTNPLFEYGELMRVMNEIVEWAGKLCSLPCEIPEETRIKSEHFKSSKYEDERQIGVEILQYGEKRELKSICKNTSLENYCVIGNAKNITAAPQTTIGIPLDKIISSLHLIASKKIDLAAPPKPKEIHLGASQKDKPTLIPAHDYTVRYVNQLRCQYSDVSEENWRKLEGIIGLISSYILTANDPSRNSYSYVKMIAPLMSRTNFSALYTAIPEDVKPFFTSDAIAKVVGLTSDTLVFGRKGASRKNEGPTIDEWIKSIIKKKDLLSPLSDSVFMEGSESMGQFESLDYDDPIYKIPLVPIELREITKSVPVYQWPKLALEIMIFSNALLRSRFY